MNKLKSVIALSLTLAASTLVANAQTKKVSTGVTTVNLDPGFLSALGTLKVTPAPLGNSQLSGTTIDFPINGGALDLSDAASEIQHSGGLRLTAGTTVVQLRDFNIETGSSQPTITGLVLVNGKIVGRLSLFNLAITADDIQTSGGFLVVIDNVGVTLTSGAAATLNRVFKISALKGGLKIGTGTVVGILSTL